MYNYVIVVLNASLFLVKDKIISKKGFGFGVEVGVWVWVWVWG